MKWDTNDYHIARLGAEDIPELIRVKAEVYGKEPSESPDRYLWKFFANPHRGRHVPFWVLRKQERIVGGIGALPVRLMVFGREIPAEFACEMFIERDKQRSGLGTFLMDTYLRESPLPLMMNTSPALLRFLVKHGFHDLSAQFRYWLQPIRPGAVLRARWGGTWGSVGLMGGPLLKVALELRAIALRPADDRSVDVEEVRCLGPWAEEIWGSAATDYPVVVIRDLKYLKWKYEQHPIHKYRIIRASRKGQTTAYLTFRFRSDQGGPLMIVQELLARKHDSGARVALLVHALAEARRQKATAVKILTSAPAVRADLRGTGFLKTRLSPGLLYREQPGFNRPELRDIGNWYLTGGDSDLEDG